MFGVLSLLVLGKSEVLGRVVNQFTLFKFDFIATVSQIERKEGELVLNGSIRISDYHAVILAEQELPQNLLYFLYSETKEVPWFSEPNFVRVFSNSSMSFSLAEDTGFEIPKADFTFREGKLQVIRSFPSKKVWSYLVYGANVVPIDHFYPASRRTERNMIKLVKKTGLKCAVINLIFFRDRVWFQDLNPTPDWDEIPESIVKGYIEYVIFSTHVIKGGSNYR